MKNYKLLCEVISLQETKWKEKVRSGELSDPAEIKKIKDAGIAPTEHQYLKGIARGTRNINKKTDAHITHTAGGLVDIMGPMTFPKNTGGPHINLPYKHKETLIPSDMLNMKDPMTRAIVNRHEADEGRIGSKIMKKLPRDRTFLQPAGSVKTRFSDVGKHMGPEVLDQERRTVNFADKLYSKAQDIKKTRTGTGEYDVVKNMTPKQIRKHIVPATMSSDMPNKIGAAFDGWYKHPVDTFKKVKSAIDYKAGSGPLKSKGSSIPLSVGQLKQGAKMLAKRFLKK